MIFSTKDLNAEMRAEVRLIHYFNVKDLVSQSVLIEKCDESRAVFNEMKERTVEDIDKFYRRFGFCPINISGDHIRIAEEW